MAQNVGTPRFYINVPEWLHTIGEIIIAPKLMTLPVLTEPDGQGQGIEVGKHMNSGKNFLAMLNCPSSSSFDIQGAYLNDIINKIGEYDGFRIATFTEELDTIQVNGVGGSIITGNYYDMPNSPELSLKLAYEYGGVVTQETRGGTTLSNANFIKPSDWGNSGAWQLGNNKNNRSGRRVWELSFRFLQSSDIMPSLGVSSYNINDTTKDVNESTDFFSQVFNRTLAGHLPFIFQADNTQNEADQFAICRFDMDSIEYTQSAYNVYDMSLKIREVW